MNSPWLIAGAYFASGVLLALLIAAIYGARLTRAYILRTFVPNQCGACKQQFDRRQFVRLNLDAYPEIPLHVQCWDDAIFSGRPISDLVAEWTNPEPAQPPPVIEPIDMLPRPEPPQKRQRIPTRVE